MIGAVELEALKKEIEREFGIKDMASRNKSQHYILARAMFFKVARSRTNYPLHFIGEQVKCHHATVIYGLSKFEEYTAAFPEFEMIYKRISGDELMFSEDDLYKKYQAALAKIETMKAALQETKKGNYKRSHKRLFEILDSIPEHHVETVAARLNPIVKMLP